MKKALAIFNLFAASIAVSGTILNIFSGDIKYAAISWGAVSGPVSCLLYRRW
jgi:hypothetical protein